MKNFILSFILLGTSTLLSAQIAVGDLNNWTNSTPSEPADWNYDFGNGTQSGTNNALVSLGESVTTTQTPGMTSGSGALLETVNATTSDFINAGISNINGILVGQWPVSAPEFESVSFNFDARPLTGDSAYVEVVLLNFSGDVISRADIFWTPANATNGWTPITLPFVSQGNSGSVQSVIISCASSLTFGTYNDMTAGSTLKVGNFVLNEPNISNVSESSILKINVYPNPSSDVLNIETNIEISSVSIVSVDGKAVANQEINGTTGQLNISNLKSGVYFCDVVTADQSVSRLKVVKN